MRPLTLTGPSGGDRDVVAVSGPSDALRIQARRHPGRWLGLLVSLFILALIAYNLVVNKHFEWSIIGHYLFSAPILSGVELTVWLTAACTAIGSVFGTLLAVWRLSDNPLVKWLVQVYVWFFRGTPVLVQLILWYNLAALYPRLSIGIPFGGPVFAGASANALITPVIAAVVGLSLNFAAYNCEYVRGGIIAVDKGQREAALAIGMTDSMTMRRIVLPQAVPIIIPAWMNEVIGLLKYTSLVSVIAVSDLLYAAEKIEQENFRVIPLLLVASIWYLALTTVLTIGQQQLERRVAHGRGTRRPGTNWSTRLKLLMTRRRFAGGQA